MKRYAAMLFCVVLVALAGTCLASAASAQGIAGYPMGPLGYGYGNGFIPYWQNQVPTPPYFAVHPPVYYSQPVARTYGYSPFAYPGTVRTPEVEVCNPQEIINPYVPTSATSNNSKPAVVDSNDKTAAADRSLLIENPFVLGTTPDQVTYTSGTDVR
ncbi:MAG: hypothetical protein R3E01_26215 [Pirellulaceae bacterium]|nr:hypothetical protein [Planctomycetales bacterium]MCA9266214.1 hypothetical protein [Planctomycetales bacterium]